MPPSKTGSQDCVKGIGQALDLLPRLGVSTKSTIVFDGAGGEERNRTSPLDVTTFLRAVSQEPWGSAFHDGMAILGVDSTQATNQAGTPAAGYVRVKDGVRAFAADYQGLLSEAGQVGYMEAKSGRRLV